MGKTELLLKHQVKLQASGEFCFWFSEREHLFDKHAFSPICWAKAADADFHDNLLRGFWNTQILHLLQPWSGANHCGLERSLGPYFRGPFSSSQPKRLYSLRKGLTRVHVASEGFRGSSVLKKPPASAGDAGSIPGQGRSPGGSHSNEVLKSWPLTPALLPGKHHEQRGLVGCSPGGHAESDTTEKLNTHVLHSTSVGGELSPSWSPVTFWLDHSSALGNRRMTTVGVWWSILRPQRPQDWGKHFGQQSPSLEGAQQGWLKLNSLLASARHHNICFHLCYAFTKNVWLFPSSRDYFVKEREANCSVWMETRSIRN